MKKQLLVALILVALPVLFFISCTKSSADQQTGTPPGGTDCDTVNMKYATDVVPILQNNCYGCHGNGNTSGSGGINLDGYANLVPYAINGILKGVITHASGFPAMPFGSPKMDACTINKITNWINRDAPNN